VVPPLFPGVLTPGSFSAAVRAAHVRYAFEGLGFAIGASPPEATCETDVSRSPPELTGPFAGHAAAGVALLPTP
jgi:hypothetical protein